MMEGAPDPQGVRSLMDQAGRLLDSAAEQLKTPRKTNSTNGSRFGVISTPGSAKKRESVEFPASHEVKRGNVGRKLEMPDDHEDSESCTDDTYTKSSRGVIGMVVIACLYVSLCAGTGCMLVAHGEVLDRVISPGMHEILQERMGIVKHYYDDVIPDTYKEIVRPVPGYIYREVCVKKVHPLMQVVRQAVQTVLAHVSLDTITSNAKEGIQNGIVVYKKNARGIQEYIHRQLGRMDPFWMAKKHGSNALVEVLGDEVPPFVLQGIIEPLVALVSVMIGACIALWIVLEVFVSAKKNC